MLKEGVIFGVVRDNQILVQERLNPNKSYFGKKIIPGGKMEDGESIEESAERELFEESDLIAKNITYLESLENTTEKGHQYIHHVVLITEFDGRLDEHKEPDGQLSFVPLSDAKTICEHPFSHQVIDVIEKALKVG